MERIPKNNLFFTQIHGIIKFKTKDKIKEIYFTEG